MALFPLFHLYGQKIPKSSIRWAVCPACPLPANDSAYNRKMNIAYGYLTVPENRTTANGRTLKLAFSIIRSTRKGTTTPPLIILHGGPGGRILGSYNKTYDLLRQERDIVLIDQRGCGFSEPILAPEMNQEILEMFAKDLTPAAETEERTAIARQAREKLTASGADLTAFNSEATSADVDDLCHLLSYKTWDLWGSSYGTRIALTMMRDFPQNIRSVILESPLPPNVPYLQNITASFRRSLNLLFDKCAADPACKLAYPDLKKDFYTAIDSLDKRPMSIPMQDRSRFPDGKFVINSQDMLLGFHQALYGKPVYPVLPLLIEQLKNRNENAMRGFVESMSNGIYRLRYGTYYSLICADCMPSNHLKAFEDSSAGFWNGLSFYRDEFSICKIWNAAAPEARDSAAVSSNIPTLILSGELDPIATVSNGAVAKRTLPNAYQYVLENTGHFVSGEEKATSLIAKFLANPNTAPGADYLVKTDAIHFTTDVHLNGGISSLAVRLPLNKSNSLYTGWIALIVLGFLVLLVVACRGLIKKKVALPKVRQGKAFYWLVLLGGLVGCYFLISLGIAISRTASENYFLLGFGLPSHYSTVLLWPYLILGLLIIQLVLISVAGSRGDKRDRLLLMTLNLPFLLFLFHFGLFY
jgi:pimeloyl-ACP methyl ester carboxylesterase